MHRRLLSLLPAALLLFAAGCGELDGIGSNGDRLVADPSYFDGQRFDCDPDTAMPSCPPFSCSVDEAGNVYDCDVDSCPYENDSTAFEYRGPAGIDLCVPPVCTVSGENEPPSCETGCAEDDVTLYLFTYACS